MRARLLRCTERAAHFDRVEWVTLDGFSAQGALSRGEIDWWELPPRDLVAQIDPRDRNITVITHFGSAIGILRFNQLYPPFDKPAARRALLPAIDHNEAMIVIAGDDPADHHDGIGLFATGTPLTNNAGIEVLQGSAITPLRKRL